MFFKIGVLRNYSHFTGKRLQTYNCEICEILKNTFFYRTPPVAASELLTSWITSKGLTMKTILDRIIYRELEKNWKKEKWEKMITFVKDAWWAALSFSSINASSSRSFSFLSLVSCFTFVPKDCRNYQYFKKTYVLDFLKKISLWSFLLCFPDTN